MVPGSQPHTPREAPESHYFSDEPRGRSAPGEVRLVLPGIDLALRTDRGVFASRGIDPGTMVLLRELPALDGLPPGPVVDLGAGYGPIACAVALRNPTRRVLAIEVNRRARELCESNTAACGVGDRVSVVPPEQVRQDPVAAIVSNPPIRIGKAALRDLLDSWLDRLAPGGQAWLVVQRHLGADSLAAWMRDEGRQVTRVRSRKGYRVLRVDAPREPGSGEPEGIHPEAKPAPRPSD